MFSKLSLLSLVAVLVSQNVVLAAPTSDSAYSTDDQVQYKRNIGTELGSTGSNKISRNVKLDVKAGLRMPGALNETSNQGKIPVKPTGSYENKYKEEKNTSKYDQNESENNEEPADYKDDSYEGVSDGDLPQEGHPFWRDNLNEDEDSNFNSELTDSLSEGNGSVESTANPVGKESVGSSSKAEIQNGLSSNADEFGSEIDGTEGESHSEGAGFVEAGDSNDHNGDFNESYERPSEPTESCSTDMYTPSEVVPPVEPTESCSTDMYTPTEVVPPVEPTESCSTDMYTPSEVVPPVQPSEPASADTYTPSEVVPPVEPSNPASVDTYTPSEVVPPVEPSNPASVDTYTPSEVVPPVEPSIPASVDIYTPSEVVPPVVPTDTYPVDPEIPYQSTTTAYNVTSPPTDAVYERP